MTGHQMQHPRHVLLTADDVMARFDCRRSKGYKLIASSEFRRDFAGRYRLDTLHAYEAGQFATPTDANDTELCTIGTRESVSTVRP